MNSQGEHAGWQYLVGVPTGMTLMAPLAGSRGWDRGELRLKS